MSTKPTTVPTWDSGAANIATPSGGRVTSGFPLNSTPTSGEVNYELMWLALWCQYLSDGNFSGASSFLSTLAVTGLITATAGVTANGLVTANAGVAVPTGQSIALAGTAYIKKSTRTRSYHPHGLLAIESASQAPTYLHSLLTQAYTDFVCSATPVEAGIRIDGLDNGDRIVNVRVYLHDITGQPALTVSLVGGNRAGSGAANAITATSAANSTTQTITLTGVNHTIGTTSVGPVIIGINTASSATGTYSVYAVEIDYDTP